MTRIAGVLLYFRAGQDSLIEVINSCLLQSREFDELIIVDNASSDGVLSSIGPRFPGISLLFCESNEGYAAGMNRGFNGLSQTPDYCFFITHEVIMQHNCVDSMVLRLDGGAVLVGPTLRLTDGKLWSKGGEISRLGKPRHAFNSTSRLSWLDGAVLGVDVGVFVALGCFDERFFLYWEDVDLGYRMNRCGRVECASDTQATQSTSLTPPYLRARGRVLMWRLHRRPLLLASSLLELIAGALAHLLMRPSQATFEELWLVLAGCKSGITESLNRGLATRRPNGKNRSNI